MHHRPNTILMKEGKSMKKIVLFLAVLALVFGPGIATAEDNDNPVKKYENGDREFKKFEIGDMEVY